MKRIFALICFLLVAAIAQAQDYRYQMIRSAPWVGFTGTITAHTLDSSDDGMAEIFQAPDTAANITSICAYLGSESGTGPTYKIGIEGVSATTGLADTVYKTGTGECSGTFATDGQSAGWKCVTPTGTTCTIARGEWAAISVRYSSGTIGPSDLATWGLGPSGQTTTTEESQNNFFPETITNAVEAKAASGVAAMYMYKTAGRTYGRPLTGFSLINFSSNSSSDEYALHFAYQCPAGQIYHIVGAIWRGTSISPGKTATLSLYDDTTVLQDASIDGDMQYDAAGGNTRSSIQYFNESALADLNCGDPYRIGLRALSLTMGWGIGVFDVSANSDLDAFPYGVDGYLSHRTGGGATVWTDVTTRRPHIHLIIDRIDPAAGGGGGSGGGGSVSIMTREITVNQTVAARRRIPLYLVDATDGLTEENAIVISGSECRIAKNGAGSTTCAGTVTFNETGLYYYEATAGDVDTIGYITVHISDSGARKFIGVANINGFDLTSATPNVNVVSVSTGAIEEADFQYHGTLQSATAGTPGTGVLDAIDNFRDNNLRYNTAIHIVSATDGAGQTKCICGNVQATKAFTLCDAWDTTPTGTIRYSLVPAPNCGGFVYGMTVTALADLFDTNSGTTSAAAVAGSLVKEIVDASGGGGGGDFIISTGTAQSVTAGPPAKMRLAAAETYGTDTLKNHTAILILTSSGNTAAAGQVMCISTNAVATDEVTFTRPYKSVPAGAITYAVIPAPNCNTADWPKDL